MVNDSHIAKVDFRPTNSRGFAKLKGRVSVRELVLCFVWRAIAHPRELCNRAGLGPRRDTGGASFGYNY